MIHFLFVIALACSTEDRFKIKCEERCEIKGNAKGIVVNGVCGCWNPENMKAIILVD